jgi:hypothetical protein
MGVSIGIGPHRILLWSGLVVSALILCSGPTLACGWPQASPHGEGNVPADAEAFLASPDRSGDAYRSSR